MNKEGIAIFWFRRDLRLEDNVGLFFALESKHPVIPLFVFDEEILDSLPKNDSRVGFIYDSLSKINQKLEEIGSSLLIKKGKTSEVWYALIQEYDVKEVFFNKDYEPYAIRRDLAICELLEANKTVHFSFKDQVIFEEKKFQKLTDCRILFIHHIKINGWKNTIHFVQFKNMMPVNTFLIFIKLSFLFQL